ncbi:TPA: GNAT family N-acetyltransferase [Citrobacter werkmanii]
MVMPAGRGVIREIQNQKEAKHQMERLYGAITNADNEIEHVDICNDIKNAIDNKFADYWFFFYFWADGKPVGAMTIAKKWHHTGVWIECLVTKPGTHGVGRDLLVYAVNHSYKVMGKGNLVLGAAYDGAERFYERFGFEETKKIIHEKVKVGEYSYPIYRLDIAKNKHIWHETPKGTFTLW